MKLNRNDLRKIQYGFNSCSNRLLQADFQDYSGVLAKFIDFLISTPVIHDYVTDCGAYEGNLEEEVRTVRGSYGRMVFSTGDTEKEEVCTVFAVLQYVVENEIDIPHGIAFGYSSSNKYQDKTKAFNDRFVMILIRHIETYLTEIGIDMGLDDKVIYNVSVHNGQAIIATDNATVSATNTVGVDIDELKKLISAVQATSTGLVSEDVATVNESIEVIEAEATAASPRKSMLRTALKALRAIKGTAEFGAAVVGLIQFVQTLL